MRSKYGARKTVVDGITFDSKKEANRYRELKLLERAGEICCLRLQVPFELIPAQYEETGEVYTKGANKGKPKRGKCIEKAITYIADFVYTTCEPHPDGGVRINRRISKEVVEDVKGMRTPVYIIKRKLFRWRYPDYDFRRYEMEQNRVSETLENILDKIDETLENLERGNEAIISASVFTLARAYDLLTQYDDVGYIEDGEYE